MKIGTTWLLWLVLLFNPACQKQMATQQSGKELPFRPLKMSLSASQKQELNNQNTSVIFWQEDDSVLWVLPQNDVPLPAEANRQKPFMHYRLGDSTLILYQGSQPVLQYWVVPHSPPAGVDSLYKRNAFIHPVWSPAGLVLTQIHPKDHYHHLGLWHPWTRLRYQSQTVDFWNLGQGSGTVRFQKFLKLEQGDVFCGFTALQFMELRRAHQPPVPLIEDRFKVRVWNAGQHTFVVDYITEQTNITADTLQLQAYRYGGLGFRATAQWQNANRFYLTSLGRTIENADGSNARWCVVGGQIQNHWSNVLFLSHPHNLNHPEPIRIWGRTFSGTFFNFCPIKFKPFIWPPGHTLKLKYRFIIQDTLISAQQAEKWWQQFAHWYENNLGIKQ